MSKSDLADQVSGYTIDGIEIIRTPIQATMRDGAILHGYRYERAPSDKRLKQPLSPTPLLCLSSELGNSREHHPFAIEMLKLDGAPKRLFTLDMRGRGRSPAKNISATSVETDAEDLISFCDAMGLHDFDLLVNGGTAVAVYLTAPQRPNMIRRVILNDGGSFLDSVGIARQTALRQRQFLPTNWNEAVANLKQLRGNEFPDLPDKQWEMMARMVWSDEDGKPTPDIQRDLERYTNSASYDVKQPDLTREVKVLSRCPTLLIRGEHSTLITSKIADKMKKIQPELQNLTAKNQGHVPLLHLEELPSAILEFLKASQ